MTPTPAPSPFPAQAATGIMARFGGGLKTPEEHAHLGTIDVVSGYSGALAVCFALLKRRRTGQSDQAQSSLAANGQLIQTQFMYRYDGMPAPSEPSGPQALGEHALYHWYQGQCGEYLFLAEAVPAERGAACAALGGALGLPAGLADKGDGELGAILTAAFAARSVDDACSALSAAGVTAIKRSTMAARRVENVTDKTAFGRSGGTFQFTTLKDHPIGGEVTIFAPCSIRSSNLDVSVGTPQPQYGQHSREVLAELGFAPKDVDAFIAAGDVKENWSQRYLPDGDPWAKQAKEYHDYVQIAARL
jgi:crotonobetainyl-CoA:carnitine CoA-transferase CaiB-like acyl-CoA transferase